MNFDLQVIVDVEMGRENFPGFDFTDWRHRYIDSSVNRSRGVALGERKGKEKNRGAAEAEFRFPV